MSELPSPSKNAVGVRWIPRVVVVLALLLGVVATVPATPASAQVAVPDAASLGRRADTAAASCWEIKQRDPAAASGSYWLVTPRLVAPERFHCDMTTDGGGWVLIGRGRNGWNLSYNGQGTPEQVRSVIDGPSAFTPRALSAPVVDGLLDGGRPDQLADGVRLRRATNADGTTRQEVRFQLTRRDRWVWTVGADHPVGTFRFGTASGSGGVTRSFGLDDGLQRVRGGTTGWGFGTTVSGDNAAGSHIGLSAWDNVALPFTQVYLRPRLTAADLRFPALPDAGAAASTQRRLLSNAAEPGAWGVTGNANGRTGELDTEVQAFAQSGNRMIVGGNFEYVQRGANATGADRVRQPYLAAFDVATGAWLNDFRPTLNGQVKDLQTLPDGTVVVAGEFTSPSRGLVALDPVTGQVRSNVQLTIRDDVSGSVSVQALDLQGSWLYLAGRFTHLTGGGRSDVYARNAARVAVATSAPDIQWNPAFDGTVVDIDASARGDRVYAAGYFDHYMGVPTSKVAVLSTVAGAPLVTGLQAPTFSTTPGRYQQAILEAGERVWYGGAEHMLVSVRRSDFARLSGNITLFGGDFQALAAAHGVVYGGCHCGDFNYSGAYVYNQVPGRPPDPNFTQADNISFTGAWDATTGEYLPEFVPGLETGRARGPWALAVDNRGVVWMGGDFTRARGADGQFRWVGGFVRYAERDNRAPTTPGTLAGADRSGTTQLLWGASSDDRGPVTYEVLRNDRVVATTSAQQLALPSVAGVNRWFVRAVDAAGNRSATTRVVVTTSFFDTSGSDHAANIEAIAAAGITQGCNDAGTLYCPGDDVTREQMATFLRRAFALPPATRDHFDDDATSTHQDSINRLAEAGITTGVGGRRFNPGGTVTREQMATFLTNAMGLTPRATGPFTDVAGIHAPNVNAVAAAGVTKGCNTAGTLYCPGNPVRRDQMASFLARALGLT